MARAAEGSLRDALSLLEQARAYCGTNITDTQVRELLGVVPEEILEELTGANRSAISGARSYARASTARRRTEPAAFLPRSHRPFSESSGGARVRRRFRIDRRAADQRPRLKQMAESFNEEDLTRFFQILLHTDDDLRHKPDARLHLEMGLLRLVNAARLAPLEEILADIEGGPSIANRALHRKTPVRSSAPAAFAASASPSLTQNVPQASCQRKNADEPCATA